MGQIRQESKSKTASKNREKPWEKHRFRSWIGQILTLVTQIAVKIAYSEYSTQKCDMETDSAMSRTFQVRGEDLGRGLAREDCRWVQG